MSIFISEALTVSKQNFRLFHHQSLMLGSKDNKVNKPRQIEVMKTNYDNELTQAITK